jgi:hypothetical protein
MEPNIPSAVLDQHPEAGFYDRRGTRPEAAASGVSWAAVAGGAFVAAAMALILIPLGAGMGLSAISPWQDAGASAATIGMATVIWLVLMQFISSSFGGYIAGRLRTKWVDVHTDEVFFRDTAHGFLVWAVGLVITVAFLGSSVGTIISGAAKAGGAALEGGATAAVAAGAASSDNNATQGRNSLTDANGYFVDSLFRPNPANANTTAAATNPSGATNTIPGTNTTNDPTAAAGVVAGNPVTSTTPAAAMSDPTLFNANTTLTPPSTGAQPLAPRGADAATRAEVTRILIADARADTFPAADRAYLTQLVAQRTGLSQADADARVNAVLGKIAAARADALQAADTARHGAAELAFWTFLSLMVGAFCASYAATIGGRQRDAARPRTI